MQTPMPGDAVILSGDYWGAKLGQIAIVDGHHYHWLSDTQVMLVFAYSAYRSEAGEVACSGGPCPFVDVADLQLASTKTITFWKWRDPRMPAAGEGRSYYLEVPLWQWNGRTRQFETAE